MNKLLMLSIALLFSIHIQSQNNKKVIIKSKEHFMCNPVTGMCEISPSEKDKPTSKKIKLIYFTDPICSNCWGIEPQLRKLKLEYGNSIDFEYKMGGLLPDWSHHPGRKPSDLAPLWNTRSKQYEMPIDGNIWIEDPVESSYPSSIAIKAAQIQNEDKAILLLRELREMMFMRKQNIAKWKNIEIAAKNVGLNTKKLKEDYNATAKILFNQDIALTKKFGVSGFPAVFLIATKGNTTETVFGGNPYKSYVKAIQKIAPNIKKENYKKDWKSLFSKFNSLTLKEFSLLSNKTKEDSKKILNQLTSQNKLSKFTIKNGSIWSLKN